MREFGPKITRERRAEILELALNLYKSVEPKRAVRASEFAMDVDPDSVVVHEIDLRWDDQRMRIATTEPSSRPPFEWEVEITSDIGESDYFKHYLITDDDVVLAQRKVLTPIDEPEAKIIIADLKAASAAA